MCYSSDCLNHGGCILQLKRVYHEALNAKYNAKCTTGKKSDGEKFYELLLAIYRISLHTLQPNIGFPTTHGYIGIGYR